MKPSESHAELLKRLNMLGWTLKSEKQKNGVFVAVGISPTDEEQERVGTTVEMALANLYRFAIRWNSVMLNSKSASLRKYAGWTSNWIDQAREIAQAYADLPAFDEKAVPAWKALAAESKKQADAIRQQIKVEVTDHPDPYPSIHAMVEDVHHNQHFVVSRAYTAHPIWHPDDVVNFRIVHDVLGHVQTRGDFGWEGENLACGAHFPLLTPLAREALFTESIGQAAYRGSFHGFGPQKIGFLDQFLHPVQEREGEHVAVPHGGTPADQIPNQIMDTATAYGWDKDDNGKWREVKPQGAPVDDRHQTGPFGDPQPMQPFAAKTSNVPVDPNADWQPNLPHELKDERGIVPPAAGSRDYIDAAATMQNANKIDTEWWNESPARQDQAIMNAFRAALLSPRKHIKWNAAHYQALMHADPKTPAVDLWDMLERAREDHNAKLGHPEGSHLAYRKQLAYLAQKIQEDNPALSTAEAMKEAKDVMFRKVKEFESLIEQETAGLMPGREPSELKRYNMARKRAADWVIEHYTPARGWMPGQTELVTASDEWQPALFDAPQQEQPTQDMSGFSNENSKYGAFMGAHLDAIAQIGDNIDAIRSAALKDMEDGGKGFHFRNSVMNMNLSGVGPKVASFVWLLLAPSSSELSIIDTHVLRGLRAGSENTTRRDYYKHERMQRAARDATGYKHMPLGMYHWGMWDMIRNPGEHSDHSALRVLDPVPWDDDSVKWDAATTAKDVDGFHGWTGPPEFEVARPYMDQAAHEFDALYGHQPQGHVPNILEDSASPDQGAEYAAQPYGVVAKPTRITAQEQANAWVP